MLRRDSIRSNGSRYRALFSTCLSTGLALVGIAACGGSESGPPVPIENLPRELASALCDNLGPCCASEGFSFDKEKCRTNYEARIKVNIADFDAAGVTYDASAARVCVDGFAASSQQCREPSDAQESCSNVFRGSKKPGEACMSGAECESRACSPAPDGSGLKCIGPRTHGKRGEPCAMSCTEVPNVGPICGGGSPGAPPMNDAACFDNDGLYCSQSHVCETLVPVGQPCTFGACAGDAFCNFQGNCEARRATGPCPVFDACTESSYCDSDFECRPRKAPGAACASPVECGLSETCLAGVCRRPTLATEAVCGGNFDSMP